MADIDKVSQSDDAEHGEHGSMAASLTETTERSSSEKAGKTDRVAKASSTVKWCARVSRKADKTKEPDDADTANDESMQPTSRNSNRGRKSVVQKVINDASTDKIADNIGDIGIKHETSSDKITNILELISHNSHENNTDLEKISENNTSSGSDSTARSPDAQSALDMKQSRRRASTVKARSEKGEQEQLQESQKNQDDKCESANDDASENLALTETATAHEPILNEPREARNEESSVTGEYLTALDNINRQDGGELPITLEEAFKAAVEQPVQSHRRQGRRYRPVATHSNASSSSPSKSSSSSKPPRHNQAAIKMPSSPLWENLRINIPQIKQEQTMKREMQRSEQQPKIVVRNKQASSIDASSKEQDSPRETPRAVKVPRGRERNSYPKEEFSSVEIMSSLSGFAPVGMLFVLMDILKGHEEGLIHVNQLAQSLGIGKPSLLAQLENLESAGLVRTISSSRAGRHLELLTPNLLVHDATDVFPLGTSGNIRNASDNNIEVGGQFSNKRLDMLYSHLKKQGIKVVSVPDERTMPPIFPKLATYMGKYYPYLKKFYERLKMTLGLGEKFEFSLENLPSRVVSQTLSFSRLMRKAGFFSEFLYQKDPHCKIVARISRNPNAINFLTGGWLEHYVRDKVISILTTHPVTLSMPYAFMKNPKIILPGNEDFELDFLLCIGEKIFWIESKTGNYMEYLPKYSRVSRLLGLTRSTSMLVSVESLNAEDKLTLRYNLSCCNMDEFQDVFRINLVRELQQLAVQSGIA